MSQKVITEEDFLNLIDSSLTTVPPMSRASLEQSWKTYFPTVHPVSVSVRGKTRIYRWKKNQKRKRTLPEKITELETKGYIIPFVTAVKQFLSIRIVNEAVLDSFTKFATEPNNRFYDVSDGTFLRENSVFVEQNGGVLVFQIYSDEVELANPLGSKKGKHKVVLFYWTLLNLPPLWRSKLKCIQLLGVINAKLLKQCGSQSFLKPFIDQLRAFQNGIELTVRGETRKWFGILLNYVGDMPASNWMGGFKESGSALKPCRLCCVSNVDLDKIHHENDCTMREKVSHALDVANVTGATLTKKTKELRSKQCGVVGSCCFSPLDYFDPTKCFVHDIMHLADEGVLNLETCLFLNKLISDNILDLDELNCKISRVFALREYTAPPPLRKEEIMGLTKLSLSSSEMSSLSDVLPLILSQNCSSETNAYYANYLLLLEIVSSLKCYSFSETDLVLLETNIQTHNTAFVSLYSNRVESGSIITPKLHALIHLPQQIRMFGPPRYFSCYRYESKNAPFKKIMKRNCNYRNIPFSLASRHQKLVALNICRDGENDFFGVFNSLNGVSSTVEIKDSKWFDILKDSGLSHVTSFSKCKISGRMCTIGSVFLTKLSSDFDLPTFSQVVDIIVSPEKFMFVMENLCTWYFEYDRFSYVAVPTKKYFSISCDLLLFKVPLKAFFFDEHVHVIPHYYHF